MVTANIFLPEALTLELAAECRKRSAEGELTPAAVGRGLNQEVREGIRGDHIQWLEPGEALACDSYLGLMESLRVAMNRRLFLGLEDFESHFAMYPPGAFYLKHLDRFRDDDRRMVSAVVYLNQAGCPSMADTCACTSMTAANTMCCRRAVVWWCSCRGKFPMK
jgi:SM-20-related protein